MRIQAFFAAALAALAPATGDAGEAPIAFSKLWTPTHATPGQLQEIPAYDTRTHTIWVARVVGVDVLDADIGALVEHIPVTDCGPAGIDPCGYVNSVAVRNGRAAFAIESFDRSSPGFVTFHDTRRRVRTGYVTVGALPDMLAFSHDGSKLLVANEATPDDYGARVGTSVPWVFDSCADDPPGSVSIIDVATRTLLATPGFAGVPTFGSFLRTTTGGGERGRLPRG